MARIPVVIVERNGEFFADPGVAVLSKGGGGGPADSLLIINTTSQDAVLRIPDAGLFVAGQGVLQVLTRRGGGANRFTGTVQAGAAVGDYSYQVLMIDSGTKAKGNSDPQIIIDN
jgi:hypothetical protein